MNQSSQQQRLLSDLQLVEALPAVRASGADYPFGERIRDWLRLRQGDTEARGRLMSRHPLVGGGILKRAYLEASVTGMARDGDVAAVRDQAESQGEFFLAFEVYWRSGLFAEVERLLEQGQPTVDNAGDATRWLKLIERTGTDRPFDPQTTEWQNAIGDHNRLSEWPRRDELQAFLVSRTREVLDAAKRFADAGVWGMSPEMLGLYLVVDQLTAGMLVHREHLPHILITGPVGCGKGCLARAIHSQAASRGACSYFANTMRRVSA